MLEVFWINEEGWGRQSSSRPLPEGVTQVSQEDYLKHEAEQMEKLLVPAVRAEPKKKAAKKTVAKTRKKVAAPKKEAVEDGS